MPTIPIFTGNLFVGGLFVGHSFDVLPDPLQAALLGALYVPRTPIRIPSSLGEHPGQVQQRSQSPLHKDPPQKIDPRVPRASEIVQQVINGLARTGSIFKTSIDAWIVPAMPRQVANAGSFNGELFFSTDDLVLKYRTPGGALFTIDVTPG